MLDLESSSGTTPSPIWTRYSHWHLMLCRQIRWLPWSGRGQAAITGPVMHTLPNLWRDVAGLLLYLYTGGMNSFEWAATRPQQWPPNTIGRYRNCDPVLTNYLVRLGVEGRGEEYLSFPQRALFDKIGIRDMVMETDPYGNFLLQGYEFGTGRDWARLGNLYLQDGVWNGERILPEGFVDFVSTVAPAWEADGRPLYGGFFWINGAEEDYGLSRFPRDPIPRDAYYMAGAGNQKTFISPSHDLVVVRLGHYKGAAPGDEGLKNALAKLMEAVPES